MLPSELGWRIPFWGGPKENGEVGFVKGELAGIICLPVTLCWESSLLSWHLDYDSLKGWIGKLAVLEKFWKQVFKRSSFDVVEVESSVTLEWMVPESQHPGVWIFSGLCFFSFILRFWNQILTFVEKKEKPWALVQEPGQEVGGVETAGEQTWALGLRCF